MPTAAHPQLDLLWLGTWRSGGRVADFAAGTKLGILEDCVGEPVNPGQIFDPGQIFAGSSVGETDALPPETCRSAVLTKVGLHEGRSGSA